MRQARRSDPVSGMVVRFCHSGSTRPVSRTGIHALDSSGRETLMTDSNLLIRERLARSILILDGAMGTMIQRHDLTEADYRGERLAEPAQGAAENRLCQRRRSDAR